MSDYYVKVSETRYYHDSRPYTIDCYYSSYAKAFDAACGAFKSRHNSRNINGGWPTEKEAVDSCISVIQQCLSTIPKTWDELAHEIESIIDPQDASIDVELLEIIVTQFLDCRQQSHKPVA